MSQENVESFKRGIEAANRRDIEAAVQEAHPEIEWRPAIPVLLGGETTVYRGHEGFREMSREALEVWEEIHFDFPEIRDLNDRVLAIGHLRARGRESGAELESPVCYLVDFKDGKVIRMWSYLDPKEALAAAGLWE